MKAGNKNGKSLHMHLQTRVPGVLKVGVELRLYNVVLVGYNGAKIRAAKTVFQLDTLVGLLGRLAITGSIRWFCKCCNGGY